MNDDSKQIDGKAGLLEYAQRIHHNQELSPNELEPGQPYALPLGFALGDCNEDRLVIFGPFEHGVYVKTQARYGGNIKVRGLDLLEALAKLVEVGPPTWQRSQHVIADYWRAQIAQCQPFMVPVKKLETRREMEDHLNTCETCRPVNAAYVAALNVGLSHQSQHLREIIDRAHQDRATAVAHYESLRDQIGLSTANPTMKARRKATQPVEVS